VVRRLAELTASFLREFPDPPEAAVALARGAALASIRLENYERREAAGAEISDRYLVLLMGSISRAMTALAAMRPKLQVERSSTDLASHLAAIAARRRQAEREAALASSASEAPRDPP
jgi:hypothetical protein